MREPFLRDNMENIFLKNWKGFPQERLFFLCVQLQSFSRAHMMLSSLSKASVTFGSAYVLNAEFFWIIVT